MNFSELSEVIKALQCCGNCGYYEPKLSRFGSIFQYCTKIHLYKNGNEKCEKWELRENYE